MVDKEFEIQNHGLVILRLLTTGVELPFFEIDSSPVRVCERMLLATHLPPQRLGVEIEMTDPDLPTGCFVQSIYPGSVSEARGAIAFTFPPNCAGMSGSALLSPECHLRGIHVTGLLRLPKVKGAEGSAKDTGDANATEEEEKQQENKPAETDDEDAQASKRRKTTFSWQAKDWEKGSSFCEGQLLRHPEVKAALEAQLLPARHQTPGPFQPY